VVAGLTVAAKMGHWIETISSGALISFGFWIAISGWREIRHEQEHGHTHAHGQAHDQHEHSQGQSTALLLSVGSSPMVEGLPAFFAAGKFGVGQLMVMSLVFAESTIVTYVALCLASVAGLENIKLSPLDHYGEVLSGLFIAAVGVIFWVWPIA